MNDCPTADVLLAFCTSELVADEEVAVRAHLNGCELCRIAVAEVVREDLPQRASGLSLGSAIGRYRIESEIGRGGMGIVYTARDEQLGRKVALKVVLHKPGDPDHQERLLREGRALAQVPHPNVVSVYDVGTFDEQVFIAMEYVAGETLTRWLEQQPRSAAQILRVFVEAGKGLAAAHRAGLVHRDFKPDNVLISSDGRVLVTDFGLARAPDDLPAGRKNPALAAHLPSLTATGAISGTPRFMAPEQLQGSAIDAKTDQFGFCVALYLALWRQAPFAAENFETLREAVLKGRLRAPPRTQVSARVRGAIARGLSTDPTQRFASMDSLLLMLRAGSTWRRPTLAIGLLIALIGTWAWVDHRAVRCQPASDRLAHVWGPQQKTDLARTLVATQAPFAQEISALVISQLDAYFESWVEARLEACMATRVRGEHSEQQLESQLACFETRWLAAKSAIGVLSTADNAIVARAAEVVRTLPDIERCKSSLLAPRQVAEPPAAITLQVNRLRERLAEAQALEHGGQYARAAELAREAVKRSEALAYLPVRAEALYQRGTLEGRLGQAALAEASLNEALQAAQASGHDETAIRSMVALMRFVGLGQQRFADGHKWNDYALSALQRYPEPEMLQVERLRALAGILDGEGRCDDELKARREVLATVERLRGKDDLLFGYALVGMGSAYACLGKDHDAETVTRSGVEVLQRVLGPNHPQTLDYLGNVAAFLSHQGRYAEAVEISRHIATLADPVNSKSILPRVHINLGLQLVGLGQFNEAEASFAVALQHAKSGNEKAWVEFGLARAERGLLHAPKAMFHVQRAIALFETYGVPDNVVEALTEEGHLALRLGRVTLALECAERAVTLADHNAGATRRSLPAALLLLGRTLNAKGRSREALVPLERAIALQVEPLGDDAVIWADTRFELAKALASQPDSRSRVERLVSEARQGYAASDRCAEQLRALDAWSRVSLR